MTPTEIISKLREGIPRTSSIISDRTGGVRIESDWESLKALEDAAAALIETLLADKERLDWVESQGNGDAWVARQSSTGRGYRIHNEWRASSAHPGLETVREAIDAARAAAKGTPP